MSFRDRFGDVFEECGFSRLGRRRHQRSLPLTERNQPIDIFHRLGAAFFTIEENAFLRIADFQVFKMRAGAVRNGQTVDGENLSRNQRRVMLFRMARHNVPFAEIESLDHRNGDDNALRFAVASVQREQTGNSVEGFELYTSSL